MRNNLVISHAKIHIFKVWPMLFGRKIYVKVCEASFPALAETMTREYHLAETYL